MRSLFILFALSQSLIAATVVVPVNGEIGSVSLLGAPSANHLLANGSAVSRSAYAGLFTVIGTTYGVGDGSTTFNLPEMAYTRVRQFEDPSGEWAVEEIGTRREISFRAESVTDGDQFVSFPIPFAAAPSPFQVEVQIAHTASASATGAYVRDSMTEAGLTVNRDDTIFNSNDPYWYIKATGDFDPGPQPDYYIRHAFDTIALDYDIVDEELLITDIAGNPVAPLSIPDTDTYLDLDTITYGVGAPSSFYFERTDGLSVLNTALVANPEPDSFTLTLLGGCFLLLYRTGFRKTAH